jgi:hypothetical protein
VSHDAGANAPEKETSMASDEKPTTNPEPSDEEKDVEGHNIFATQDYYFQRTHERNTDVERDARQRERAKEAEKAKRDSRR